MKKPDFWASATAAQELSPENRAHPNWSLARASYEAWNPEAAAPTPIPRIIHQIWLGSPLPKLYAGWAETWRRFHPGWEYRLWTEAEIGAFGLQNRESYERSPNYGVKSDLARYEILERLGGIYADTDFECLGSFDQLARSTRFFAGLMYGPSGPINNGLIGSVPGHPALRQIVSELSTPFSGHDGMEILAYSGPIRFGNVVRRHLQDHPGDGSLVLPTSVLYPFPNRKLDNKQIAEARSWARPESLAIHYWEVSWKKDPWTTRAYWWAKRRLPAGLVRGVYRLVKGKDPAS